MRLIMGGDDDVGRECYSIALQAASLERYDKIVGMFLEGQYTQS